VVCEPAGSSVSEGGESSPTVSNSTFLANTSVGTIGGAIFNDGSNGGKSRPSFPTSPSFCGYSSDR
jgi:hypothetical protein